MGYGLVAGAWRGTLRLDNAAGGSGTPGAGVLRFGHVPSGVIMTLANPYWSFWWATVGAGRITAVAAFGLGPLAIGGLALAHWLTDLGWLGGLGLATSSGRKVMGAGVYRAILLACGAFLLAFGIYLGWSGVSFLFGW
jgi:threonine/homoserine/homoserine lactone efflux protein